MTIFYGKPLARTQSVSNPIKVPNSVKLGGEIGYWTRLIKGRFARHRSRKQLNALSDEHLRDIGLNREQVRDELAKGFWR